MSLSSQALSYLNIPVIVFDKNNEELQANIEYVRKDEIEAKYFDKFSEKKELIVKRDRFYGSFVLDKDNNQYLSLDTFLSFAKEIIYSPKHLLLFPEAKVRKSKEMVALSYFYKFKKDKFTKYEFEYQKKIGKYFIDLYIFSTDGSMEGIGIEIDENNHSSNEVKKEEEREETLLLSGIKLIRIPVYNVSNVTEAFMLPYIDQAKEGLQKQIELTTSDIQMDYLEEKLKECNIPSDFYQMIGKAICHHSLACDISLDDIIKYLGIVHNRNFVSKSLSKLQEEVEYIEVKAGDIVGTAKTENRGGSNKRHFLVSTDGFYKLCMFSNSSKAKLTREWFIEVYKIAYQLLKLKTDKLRENVSCERHTTVINFLKAKINHLESERKNEKRRFNSQIKKEQDLRCKIQDKLTQAELEIQKLRQGLVKEDTQDSTTCQAPFEFLSFDPKTKVKIKDVASKYMSLHGPIKNRVLFYRKIKESLNVRQSNTEGSMWFIGIKFT
jgi:very-short-patch-repair endonuclease/prophage antirepressor-like protein